MKRISSAIALGSALLMSMSGAATAAEVRLLCSNASPDAARVIRAHGLEPLG